MKLSPILLLCALLCPLAASAKDMPAFQPPGDFTLLALSYPPPPGQPFEYGASGPAPTWNIAQWGNPGKLTPFTTSHDGADTILTSASTGATVVVTRGSRAEIYDLSQTGAALPCETSPGNPREFDLFASPEGSTSHPPGQNAYRIPANQIALSTLTHLRVQAIVSLHYASLPVAKSCAVSQGGVLIAVILNNLVAHQTLFYQLGLGSMCGPQPAPRAALCKAAQTTPGSNFFFPTNPFGVDDALPLLGQPWLQNNQTASIDADLLPRLLHFIRTGPPGMDHNPAHWVFGSSYNGQHIWGNVTMQTTWKAVGLVLSTR